MIDAILDRQAVTYSVGMRVRATCTITESGDLPHDPDARPLEPLWAHAHEDDEGIVEHVTDDRDGFPTVRFFPTGTATIVSHLEIMPVIEDADERAPIPQADDLDLALDVVAAVVAGHGTPQEIAAYLGYDERQGYYYGNAAVKLGFLRRKRGQSFTPTADGVRCAQGSLDTRKALVLAGMRELPVFSRAAERVEHSHEVPSVEEVTRWLVESSGLARSTAERRAQTVVAWCDWLLSG